MASLTGRLLFPIRWENWVRYSAFASINSEATQRLKTPAPARTCLIVPVRLSSTSDLYQRPQHPAWRVNMLYDSECPLCVHEVKFLEKRDRKSYVKFTDINALDYDPALNGHVTYEEGMKKIHAVLTDGTVINGVPAFEKIRHHRSRLGLRFYKNSRLASTQRSSLRLLGPAQNAVDGKTGAGGGV